MTRALTALAFLAVILGCAHAPLPPPRDGEGQAVWIIWRTVYGREDTPPKVRWVRGADLDCTDPTSGKPGFVIADVGDGPDMPIVAVCREGLTMSPLEVKVADHGEAFSDTALAHELKHADNARNLIYDPKHLRPEWQPGGEVDRANKKLREAGL